jgi:CarD family transcriptional regulator
MPAKCRRRHQWRRNGRTNEPGASLADKLVWPKRVGAQDSVPTTRPGSAAGELSGMKAPARAKGSKKKRPASGTAQAPSRPAAKAKQVAPQRRTAAPTAAKPTIRSAVAKPGAAKPAAPKAPAARVPVPKIPALKTQAPKAPAPQTPAPKISAPKTPAPKTAPLKSATSQPAAPKPVAATPATTAKPATSKPAATKPAVAEAAAAKPAPVKPAAGKAAPAPPVAAKPASDKPIPVKSAMAQPVPAKPAMAKPSTAAGPVTPAAVPPKPVGKPPVATVAKAGAQRPAARPGGFAEAQAVAPSVPPLATPPASEAGRSAAPPAPHPVRREGPSFPPPRQPSKPVEFKTGDHVVYPTHGVGTVQGIETMSAAGHALQVIVVTFEENRMTLRVPVGKAASSGLRKLTAPDAIKEALDTLKGRARIKRTMWSRRAQEYEAKINSGDPVAIAEVVRDLHRNAGQPDQSFSERQIYEQAMDRLAAEVAAIDCTDKVQATEKLLAHLKAG